MLPFRRFILSRRKYRRAAVSPGFLLLHARYGQLSPLYTGQFSSNYLYCFPSVASKSACTKGSFCGAGSVLPQSLTQGHYAVDASGNIAVEEAVDEAICQAGSYCSGGERTTCEAGHVCAVGASLATEARPGYYTSDSAGKFMEEGAVEERLCPAGSYCVEGNIVPCASSAEETESAQYCPPGSTAPGHLDRFVFVQSYHALCYTLYILYSIHTTIADRHQHKSLPSRHACVYIYFF